MPLPSHCRPSSRTTGGPIFIASCNVLARHRLPFTCCAIVFSGWRRRSHLISRQHGGEPALRASPPFDLVRMPFASAALDIATEARDVLARMATEAAGCLVQLEVAVQPGLAVHADRFALRAVLSQLVGNAIRHAAGGRVLLSASRLGGRVQIAVIDDGVGPDAVAQEAALREVVQLVALQGGTIEVEAQRGEGTTVLVRLPESDAAGRAPSEIPKQRPAARTTAAPQIVLEAVAGPSWEI
jgi:anti-sigma regulatory factor (Ser/Thr protein kinase)